MELNEGRIFINKLKYWNCEMSSHWSPCVQCTEEDSVHFILLYRRWTVYTLYCAIGEMWSWESTRNAKETRTGENTLNRKRARLDENVFCWFYGVNCFLHRQMSYQSNIQTSSRFIVGQGVILGLYYCLSFVAFDGTWLKTKYHVIEQKPVFDKVAVTFDLNRNWNNIRYTRM